MLCRKIYHGGCGARSGLGKRKREEVGRCRVGGGQVKMESEEEEVVGKKVGGGYQIIEMCCIITK